MRVAVVGAGAVGGYLGAELVRAGHDVVFVDVGEHLRAIRDCGLAIRSPLGNFVAKGRAEMDPAAVGESDLVLFTVKSYHNAAALETLKRIACASTSVLTLQNGVDSIDQVAAAVGTGRVVGGAAYLATGIVGPGVIEQTGSIRRIVMGEVFGERSGVSARVAAIARAFRDGGIEVEEVANARVPIWQKFIYLSVIAGLCASTRLPIGPLWTEPAFRELFMDAVGEVVRVARAEAVALPDDINDRILHYVANVSPAMRPSLLIDLSQGKPLEVDALLGSVVRRGQATGVPTPIMRVLYRVLQPHANGTSAAANIASGVVASPASV